MEAARTVRHRSESPPITAILAPSVNVWTMPRRFSIAEGRAFEEVAAGPEFEREARIDVSRPEPGALLTDVGHPVARQVLAHDIVVLAKAFGGLLERRHLHASLSVVRRDMCRKLHADYVTLRLLCTYAGPGTEWVADDDVVRANLGRQDVDAHTANRSVLRRPDALRRCAAGDVILLKGESFKGNRGSGAVHRSPSIEGRRQSRLLLKIDENPCGC